LIEATNFETDEALLTGESLPVAKVVNTTFDEETGPGDRLNLAYSSSTVTKGRAKGVVVSTVSYHLAKNKMHRLIFVGYAY
jgi:Na+-exporting ATPase